MAIAAKTLREAEAAWLMSASDEKVALPGVDSGLLIATSKGFTLWNYSITPGVTLSGKVIVTPGGPPLAFKGVVTVGGKMAAHGVLHVSGGGLRGRLIP
jgi:hypothetical protein